MLVLPDYPSVTLVYNQLKVQADQLGILALMLVRNMDDTTWKRELFPIWEYGLERG